MATWRWAMFLLISSTYFWIDQLSWIFYLLLMLWRLTMGWIWLLIFLLTHFDWASSLIVLVSILMSGCVITKVVNNFGLYFILFFLVKFLESHLNNLLKLLNFFIHFDVENIVLVVADFADFLPDFFEPFIFQLPLFLLLVLPFPHFFLFSGFIINPRFL